MTKCARLHTSNPLLFPSHPSKGNHDISLDEEFYKKSAERFHYSKKTDDKRAREVMRNCPHFTFLEDSSINLFGYDVFGSPWQPEFCNWAFNLERGNGDCAEVWERIPTATDILITHGPALGESLVLDALYRTLVCNCQNLITSIRTLSMPPPFSGHGDLCHPHNQRAGCADLLSTILERVKPLYHVCGHIHEGYGVTKMDGVETTFINASTCDFSYKPINPAVVFDLPPRRQEGDLTEKGIY